ncbi:transposase [Cellulomonas fimi]|uniref:transposase n=1 Tax=Cellulomonas fimi TaxID=1708 RepID=UPI000F6F9A27|nr:transposase [Cellulomonas fimi]NNH05625.1 transposase [Cellulomonas fimi]VEH35353.1 Transposase [Cellulomonas fimi]
MGRRGYPPEFRRKVLDLLDAGRSVADVARDLEISAESIYTWRRQDRIDRGLVPGLTSAEKSELSAARKRIAELEAELAIHRRASELLGKVVPPRRRYEAIAVMAAQGHAVQVATRELRTSESGFYAWRRRAPSQRSIRHVILTDAIRQIHAASNGIYGARRVHAELVLGRDIPVWHGTVEMLMARDGLRGVAGRPTWHRPHPDLISADLVDRQSPPRRTGSAVGSGAR